MNNLNNEVVLVLKESLLFHGFPEDLLFEIAKLASIVEYSKNQEIFGEGDRALGFYLVLDGNVKIYKLSSKGKEQIIHLFGRGDIFAEIVLAGIETYPAYAKALTKVRLAFFEKGNFLNLIKRNPDVALKMIALFAARMKQLVNTIESLTLREARERILLYLWKLSDEGRKQSFTLGVNKVHLALLLGIAPETLSRLLQKLKEEGYFKIEHKKFILTNIEKWKSALRCL